jgi:hypothetical protein
MISVNALAVNQCKNRVQIGPRKGAVCLSSWRAVHIMQVGNTQKKVGRVHCLGCHKPVRGAAASLVWPFPRRVKQYFVTKQYSLNLGVKRGNR